MCIVHFRSVLCQLIKFYFQLLTSHKKHQIIKILGEYVEIENHLDIFTLEGFASFQLEWNSLDRFFGRQVRVDSGLKTLAEGISLGVDASGALRVDTGEGEKKILGGELSPSLVLS